MSLETWQSLKECQCWFDTKQPSINTNTHPWSAAGLLGLQQVVSNIYLILFARPFKLGCNENCKHPHLPNTQ